MPLPRTEIIGTPALSLSIDGIAQSLTQGDEIAVRAPMDGSTSVAIANAPLVFIGYGVNARSGTGTISKAWIRTARSP